MLFQTNIGIGKVNKLYPLVQILLGLPLEIVHGPFRIGAVYVAGVLTGSLARDSTQKEYERNGHSSKYLYRVTMVV